MLPLSTSTRLLLTVINHILTIINSIIHSPHLSGLPGCGAESFGRCPGRSELSALAGTPHLGAPLDLGAPPGTGGESTKDGAKIASKCMKFASNMQNSP